MSFLPILICYYVSSFTIYYHFFDEKWSVWGLRHSLLHFAATARDVERVGVLPKGRVDKIIPCFRKDSKIPWSPPEREVLEFGIWNSKDGRCPYFCNL